MKKYMFFPLLTLAGGAGAFVLRLLQRLTGFEAATGLPIPGNLPAMALMVWFLAVAAVCFFVGRVLLPADREEPLLFPASFSVASAGLLTLTVMGIFLLAVSGVLDLVSGLGDRVPVLTGGDVAVTYVYGFDPGHTDLFSANEHIIVGVLSLAMAVSLFPAAAACRRSGERKPFQGSVLLVPVCCLVVRLVLTYRAESADPALIGYYPEILAVVFLTLAFYRLSSFAFGAGRTRRFALYTAMAAAFCLASLAGGTDLPRLTFYAGGALTLFGFLVQRTAVLSAPWDNL